VVQRLQQQWDFLPVAHIPMRSKLRSQQVTALHVAIQVFNAASIQMFHGGQSLCSSCAATPFSSRCHQRFA
jgi:hypothetical protein